MPANYTIYDRRGNVSRSGRGSVKLQTGTTVRVQGWPLYERTLNATNQVGQIVERAGTVGPPYEVVADIKGVTIDAKLGPVRPGTTETFHYDRRGNLIDDGRRHYAYDAFNRLVEATDLSSGAVTGFHYDAF